jgi:hypothetical protein
VAVFPGSVEQEDPFSLVTFLTLVFIIGWVASIAWQLWLAETKGKIWARNGYIKRESNETTFGICVATYWVFLGFGIVMLHVMVIVVLKGGFSE